jgi:hypothetical protein
MRPLRTIAATLIFAALPMFPLNSRAHCDTMDGPVVKAARKALESGRIEQVLYWVPESGEAELRAAFAHVLQVRKLGNEAQQLADRYFYETVVRVHRAGENAPYSGLKAAGEKLPDAILAGDRAVETGDPGPVISHLQSEVAGQIAKRLQAVQHAKNFGEKDIAAGRAFVKAYVEYIHTVEAVHNAAIAGEHEHSGEAQQSSDSTAHKHTRE